MALARKAQRRTNRYRAECPDDLFDYAARPVGSVRPCTGQNPKDDLSTWTVTDDWPERVPVTSAEVDVFEAWFGDVFDELFGPCR
ncbi:hypothetical protein RCO27_01055 [Sphingosinicella sp. LHD-64]|uniref:hypothetical protein n=1 Tax=Sphingosinicella sp. LHD-64 TaxID=3072139 RepID=UPI00280F8C04|nr:hypothetical protein [Sphingosinicella sp. LHD-64]MDQ8754804.1 hypothetical protein [Sphingosinicella sp. LHD-64]